MVTLPSTGFSYKKRSKRRMSQYLQTTKLSKPAKAVQLKKMPTKPSPTPPGLDAVPSAYKQDFMTRIGPQLLETVSNVTDVLSGIYPDSRVDENSPSSSMEPFFLPTHILALCGPRSSYASNQRHHIILQPTHRFILASQCTNLPEMSEESAFSLVQPTFCAVPLHLPHPTLFEPLHRYLYNHDTNQLLQFLLPSLCGGKGLKLYIDQFLTYDSFERYRCSLSRVASLLSVSCSKNLLLFSVQRLSAFTENIVALGIRDDDILRTISTASFVLRSALSLKQSLQPHPACP